MAESFFDEMKRYVRFGADDEAALRDLGPHAAPHFRRIADEFYTRLHEHESARAVFSGPEQVERLQGTLCVWMRELFEGPWDAAYYDRRARIGRMHVKISLPQRYMFSAMNLIRVSLSRIAHDHYAEQHLDRERAILAVERIIDLELAIMLETYREAFVDKVQHLERLERNLLERRLAISEARYEEIVEKAEVLIATFEPDGRIVLFNRICEETTGLTRARAVGRDWMEVFVPARDRAELDARRPEILAGRRVPAYEGEVAGPGGGERLVRWHFTTLPGGAGPLLCAIGIDVTEERELAGRSQRAERLAALGTMAAGLAHEIRNPLNAAHLQLTLVQRRLARTATPELASALEAATLAGNEMKRLAALVEEFLSFARPQPLRMSKVDLRATAEVIVTLLAPEAHTAGVDLLLLAGERVTALVDDERIKQVLFNLVRNAVEAAGRGGRVELAVHAERDSVVIEVWDDGPGLPEPEAPIFEPFYTTKEGGTGLGLAIVHRIVTDHSGEISYERRANRTLFKVALPDRNRAGIAPSG